VAAQDVAVSTSLPQVLTSPLVNAQLGLTEEPLAPDSPIQPVIMTPTLPLNLQEDLRLAVQRLRTAVVRDEANLLLPLAAALDGFAKLGDRLKVCIHWLHKLVPYGVPGILGQRERVCCAQGSTERVSRDRGFADDG